MQESTHQGQPLFPAAGKFACDLRFPSGKTKPFDCCPGGSDGMVDSIHPPDEFQAAVRAHESGDLDGAEAAYRRILDGRPGHADALHLLGVVEHQRGRHDEAIGLIARAILPGSDSIGLIATAAIGIVGAIIGGFIAELLDFGGLGSFFEIRTWIIAVAGSLLLLLIVRAVTGGSRHRDPLPH